MSLEQIASDGLKGRVFEVSLADLQQDEDQAFRKIKLRAEDVQGRNVLTNFWVCLSAEQVLIELLDETPLSLLRVLWLQNLWLASPTCILAFTYVTPQWVGVHGFALRAGRGYADASCEWTCGNCWELETETRSFAGTGNGLHDWQAAVASAEVAESYWVSCGCEDNRQLHASNLLHWVHQEEA